ncbi:MazG family protein [Deinococcus peraridilitoris]|uniref:MazG family protein n=1 Tax=Deinococcus peraridilitoris (strain DSM 19664 / LMG 22246 / CIP 109416 / KR-200) TaxID=937777 RepID=K9ZVR3_DEIPD|nr:MazG family protein [Deinococcus peraridilitoris]AFZ65616.1 MazG family protein [Deinococcus peraridilitoris DSM 19664]
MKQLLKTLRQLRAPDGCPWDREQTHLSLRPYLLEEAAEAVDAISRHNDEDTIGELGDVLLQVAFHAVIGEEEGRFEYADIEDAIVQKLIRRHPHVFAGVPVQGTEEVMRNWQEIKRQERSGRERLPHEEIPASLGALARETALQNALPQREPAGRSELHRLVERIEESEAGFGELLASVVSWARSCGVDAEVALRAHRAGALP